MNEWKKIHFIYGNDFILSSDSFFSVFHSYIADFSFLALGYFILLWQVFHSASHPCARLIHWFMADFSFHASSFPWLISIIYGRFFIPLLILALAFFILLWHIFHFLPHPCPVLFHYFVAGFSFLASGLFHLFMAGYSFLALDYFIDLWQVFHSLHWIISFIYGRFFILCPGLFHWFMAGFSFCVSSLPWIISLFCGRFFILHFIFALDYFILL